MLKDLYRCLSEYPDVLLQAISEAWEIPLPKEEPLQMIKSLAEGMLAPDAAPRIVASLSEGAREALAYLQAQGHALPMRAFALRFGALQRFGPARLRRERPWETPQNPAEELYFKGLIYRAYGALEDFYGDLVLIPHDLAERLPPLESPSFASHLRTLETVAIATPQGEAFLEDIVTLLATIRHQPLRAHTETAPSGEELLRAFPGLGLQGPRDPTRLALLARLMVHQGLLKREGHHWRVAQEARQWLQQSDAEQWLSVFIAWRDAPENDLADIPTLICEQVTWDAAVRARFCRILAQCTAGPWYALEDFLAALRHHYPDYLRLDGDFDAWLIRDAQSHVLLRGLASWDAVEGALARHLLTGPLYWLGVVDLGLKNAASQPEAFRLTHEGKALLTEHPPMLAGPVSEPPATIDASMTIRIALRNTRYLRYNLDRLAENLGIQGEWGTYRLTEDSIWQALNSGIQASQILAFLKRITGGQVPPPLAAKLQTWEQRFGRLAIRRAVILEAVDAATLREIQKIPEINRLLTPLGPTRCLVEYDNLETLVERLKKRGIWPRVKR